MSRSSTDIGLRARQEMALSILFSVLDKKYADAGVLLQQKLVETVDELDEDGDLDDYFAGDMSLNEAVKLAEKRWRANRDDGEMACCLQNALNSYIDQMIWDEDDASSIWDEATTLIDAGELDGFLIGNLSLSDAFDLVMTSWRSKQDEVTVISRGRCIVSRIQRG